MVLLVERASYSTKRWETIQTLLPTSEMRHINDHSNPDGLTKYVFGYSGQSPILVRVLAGVIEEMHIIEPDGDYLIDVKRTRSSSKRTIRFRILS